MSCSRSSGVKSVESLEERILEQGVSGRSDKEQTNKGGKTFHPHIHPHNHAVKSIILKNFKLLQNDTDTGRIFSQCPLISFKRDKNIGNFLVRRAFQNE